MDWTGSAQQRREQGGCKPPTQPPNKTPRYIIPSGTRVKIRRVEETAWRPYATTKQLGFYRYEKYERHARTYVFRDAGYLLRIPAKSVQHGSTHHT